MAGAIALGWPALYNGFPLLFPDSVNYLNDGRVIVGALVGSHSAPMGWMRSPLYSLVTFFVHWGRSPWPVVALQTLITAAMLWLVVRSVLTGRRVPIYLGLVGSLSVVTGLGWVVSWLLPDVLGPALYLGGYLLVYARETLSLARAGLVACVVVWAAASHSTHLMLAVALAALLGLLLLVGPGGLRPPARSVRRFALLVAAALTAHVALTGMLTGRPSLSGRHPPLLMARLIADGPARQVLQDRCDELHWVICRFVDRLPGDSNEFLWGAGGVMASVTPEEAERLRREELPLLWLTLRDHPAGQMRASLANFGRQLVTFGMDDFGNNAWAERAIAIAMPGARVPYGRSRQSRDAMPSEVFSRLQTWTIAAAVLVLAVTLPICWRRGHRRLLGLGAVLIPMIVANAMVTGVLSVVDSRYQLRVAWLLPLLAALIVMRLLEERRGAPPAARGASTR